MYYEICLAVVDLADRVGLNGVNRELPRLRNEVRRKVSPYAADFTEKLYREVHADPTLPVATKQRLERAYEYYERLKKEAEELTAPTVDEFQQRVEDAWGRFDAAVRVPMHEAEISLTVGPNP